MKFSSKLKKRLVHFTHDVTKQLANTSERVCAPFTQLSPPGQFLQAPAYHTRSVCGLQPSTVAPLLELGMSISQLS